MHKFINQQYLDWKEGWQRSISKQLLLCICDIFFPYNIDHSTKNVCSGIFLLKHTYALFVKVESGKNSGSEKDKHARGKRWHQYWHLSWGWLTFVFWHIERCICWIIIGGGWWLSDHLAATVSSWWGSLHTTYIPSLPLCWLCICNERKEQLPTQVDILWRPGHTVRGQFSFYWCAKIQMGQDNDPRVASKWS